MGKRVNRMPRFCLQNVLELPRLDTIGKLVCLVLDISGAYVNACMTSMNAVSEHDGDTINIPKSFAESRRCEQREKWRVARLAEKDAPAKRGVGLPCKTPSGVT